MIDSWRQDFRFAVRGLRKRPAYATVVVLTLALGIGASTAVFSVANTLLFKPLPFEKAERLVRMRDAIRRPGQEPFLYNSSPRSYFLVKENSRAFESAAAMRFRHVNVTGGGGNPVRVRGIGVSRDWLETIGVRPHLGRDFTAAEEARGRASGVVLIGHGLWQRRFGGNPETVGRTVSLNGAPFTVVGVMPPRFSYPYAAEVWTPERFERSDTGHAPNVVARLKAGWSLEQAQEDLDALSRRAAERYPDSHAGLRLLAVPLRSDLLESHPREVLVLLGAVLLLLLIASVNVANLVLVRSADRREELAVRSALGAGVSRQLRLLLTEGMLLAALGGTLGIVVAASFVDVLAPLSVPETFAFHAFFRDFGLDWRVLGFGLATSATVALLFSLAPTLEFARPDLRAALRDRGRTGAGGGGRLLDGLLVAEVAITLALLVTAGTMAERLRAVRGADPGYEPEGRLVASVHVPDGRYGELEDRVRFVDDLLRSVRGQPGVEAAAVTSYLPAGDPGTSTENISVEGGPTSEPGADLMVNSRVVSEGYFEALGIQVVAGRDFTRREVRQRRDVVVVNRPFAERYWPDGNPVGRRVRRGRLGETDEPWLTVVGVVADVAERGDVAETWYVPASQGLGRSFSVVARVSPRPGTMAEELREAVWEVDPELPVDRVVPFGLLVNEEFSDQRRSTIVVGAFALFGLLLAALGVYGVLSFAVRRRDREIGIRLAVGAAPRRVRRLVVGKTLRLLAVAVTAGLVLALGASRLSTTYLSASGADTPFRGIALERGGSTTAGADGLGAVLPGIDPLTLAGLTLFVVLVALAASWIPALRASRIDPMQTLRAE